MLEGFSALDLTDLKGQFAGKLLAELGMRVTKVEPPEGDVVRRIGPFKDGVPHPEASLRFAFLNGGKESLVVDDQEALGRLAADVDLVLESGPPGALDVEALRRANPELVVVSITGFGQTGPRAGYRDPDIVALAMGGLMSISGEASGAPVCAPETQAYYFGSVFAALGALLALRRRELGGGGDHVDVSIQAAVATQEHLIREALFDGVTVRREGSQHKHVAPGRIFPCRDGHVFLFVSTVHWARFLELWRDHPAQLDSEEWRSGAYRREHAAFINEHVERFTRGFDKLELTEHLQANGIPCLPVYAPSEFVADAQVRASGLFATLEHPVLGSYLCPQLPLTLDGRRLPASPPPLLGAHRGPSAARPPAPHGAPGMPLEGIRVVSLTTGIAGPNAARHLANYGAEVIKVESRAGGLDSFRHFGEDIDASSRFLETNLDVKSVTLNLKQRDGARLLKELVARADVVLENFRPDVLPRLGLGYDALRAVHPAIIVARMPGLGSTGPRSLYGSWGPTLAAFTGFTYLWNHPGQPEPVGSQGVYADYLAGVLAPLVVTAALIQRAQTGEGALLDLAQAEAAAYTLGTTYLGALLNGEEPQPRGNGCPQAALQGCYRCAGADRWCVIACPDEGRWQALCAESGIAPDAPDRDGAVGDWTASLDPYALMERLQAAGVACGVVQGGGDLATDPQLLERGFIQSVRHPKLGEVRLAGLPLRFAQAPTRPFGCAPLLGEHNEEIVCDLLGHSRAELAAWQEAKVVY